MNKLNQEANRAKWLQHVNKWSKSGLTQSGYCRQHGLSSNLFSAWVGRVKKAPGQSGADSLTMVPLVIEAEHARAITEGGTLLLQHKSGWQLSLAADTEVVWLSKLLSQLV
jgi:transposase